MAGQRTRLRFGAVSAEVLLEKTSTKPRAAQHETRRVLVANTAAEARDAYEQAREAVPVGTDPFGDPIPAAAATSGDVNRALAGHGPPVVGDFDGADDDAPPPAGEGLPPGLLGPMGDPTWPQTDAETFDAPDPERPWDGTNPPARGDSPPESEWAPGTTPFGAYPPSGPREAPVPEADAAGGPGSRVERQAETYTPPATRVEQGVHLETGEWVDLTDRLADVDARTRVDGLEVVRTIPASSYASERVRDAHYLAGVEPESYKVLALLWRALRAERMAAEVRWTKRTAQANGIVVARGELGNRANPAHLLLLELEWAANVRKPTSRVFGPIRAEVADGEVYAAVDLVRSFAAPAPRVELRDERLAKRAELLTLAKAGKLAEYVPPVEPMPEDVGGEAELAEALALSSAWVREHAPA